MADPNISAVINANDGLTLVSDDSSDFTVEAVTQTGTTSLAAAALGILGTSTNGTLIGQSLFGESPADRVVIMARRMGSRT